LYSRIILAWNVTVFGGKQHHSQITSQKFPPLTFKTLTLGVTFVTMWPMEEQKVTHSIKIKLSILRKGKVAAVSANKSLGQWLEEAIMEKIEREQKLSKEVER